MTSNKATIPMSICTNCEMPDARHNAAFCPVCSRHAQALVDAEMKYLSAEKSLIENMTRKTPEASAIRAFAKCLMLEADIERRAAMDALWRQREERKHELREAARVN